VIGKRRCDSAIAWEGPIERRRSASARSLPASFGNGIRAATEREAVGTMPCAAVGDCAQVAVHHIW
jgi:hypothetical protein